MELPLDYNPLIGATSHIGSLLQSTINLCKAKTIYKVWMRLYLFKSHMRVFQQCEKLITLIVATASTAPEAPSR